MSHVAIVLDTPHVYDPGHGGPTYTSHHVFMARMTNDAEARRLVMTFKLGNLVDGEWQAAPVAAKDLIVENKASEVDPATGQATDPANDFTALVSSEKITQGDVGAYLYILTAQRLYQRAVDAGLYSGTVQVLP